MNEKTKLNKKFDNKSIRETTDGKKSSSTKEKEEELLRGILEDLI
jgi:hypothetical protein